MKIAFISDIHLGFAYGTERGEESFENCKQAFDLALKDKPDLILLGGDIFHDRIPRQEVLGRAIELFTDLNHKMKKVLLLKTVTRDKEEVEKKQLIPAVIGIWGTHERRHAESTNPVQLLEKAGLMRVLHAESMLVEVGYEKLGIHGLSGVPEDYSRDALKSWKPEPFENAHNVLMLHQNLQELIPVEGSWIKFSDLPDKFDLFLFGHFHWQYEDEHPKSKAPIVIPGSLVVTQLNQKEASREKGFFMINQPPEKDLRTIDFKPIPTRKAHYCLLEVKDRKPAEIQFMIVEAINKALQIKTDLKPMIKVKLKGNFAKGFITRDLSLSKIYNDYRDRAILDIDKGELTSADSVERISRLQELKEKKISVDTLGLEMIKKNLSTKIETEKLEQLFDFLAEEELEKAEELL